MILTDPFGRWRSRTRAEMPSESGAGDRGIECCAACGAQLFGRFCACCGERRASERRYSIAEFLREALASVLSVDGRAARTFLSLIRRPGELTVAYARGVRQPYLSPLNCFLLANLFYFVLATAVGSNTLATPLSVHTQQMPYRRLAQAAVAARLSASGENPAEFAARFDAVGRTEAKSLVVLMVPAFAILVAAAAFGTRRRAVHHVVFSLHVYAAILISIIACQPVAWCIALVVSIVARGGRPYAMSDAQVSAVLAVGLAIYLIVALRRAYEMAVVRATLSTTGLLYGVALILTCYRGLLFEATLNAVR